MNEPSLDSKAYEPR